MKHTPRQESPELEAILSVGRRPRLENSREDESMGDGGLKKRDPRAPPEAKSYVQYWSLYFQRESPKSHK